LNNDLLVALSRCRSARLVIQGPTPARSGVTTTYAPNYVTKREPWSRPATPAYARISLSSESFKIVRFRQRRGESIEALCWRALAELQKREVEGMPKPTPKERERRRRRKLLDSASGVPS
jgi:hypothetical protein